jgi:hypothetical protein
MLSWSRRRHARPSTQRPFCRRHRRPCGTLNAIKLPSTVSPQVPSFLFCCTVTSFRVLDSEQDGLTASVNGTSAVARLGCRPSDALRRLSCDRCCAIWNTPIPRSMLHQLPVLARHAAASARFPYTVNFETLHSLLSFSLLYGRKSHESNWSVAAARLTHNQCKTFRRRDTLKRFVLGSPFVAPPIEW